MDGGGRPANPETTEVAMQEANAGGRARPPVRRYVRYNISGNFFVVTAKYQHPVQLIGKGAFGSVCSAMNSETGEMVAIKKISNAFTTARNAKNILREIKILRHMNHPNIISIKDIIPPLERQIFDDAYIVYELMYADLTRYSLNHHLREDHCQYILYQILLGLKYIHSANVLHRDLKPNNILLNNNLDLKICDFGYARTTAAFMTDHAGTRWYRSPELLLNTSQYSSAVDVWSLGCVYMEIMLKRPLFPGNDPAHQLHLLLQLIGSPTESDMEVVKESVKNYLHTLPYHPPQSFFQVFPNVNPLAIDLVEKMLRFDPRKRITVEDALAHPYLDSMRGLYDEPLCSTPLNCDFEQQALTVEQIKDLIYMDALEFNPQHRPEEIGRFRVTSYELLT